VEPKEVKTTDSTEVVEVQLPGNFKPKAIELVYQNGRR